MNNYMKRVVKFGAFQGVTFILILTVISYWVNENTFSTALALGIIGGIVVGVANGILNYKFPVAKYILDAVIVDLDSDESIQFQSPANYTSGVMPISGKLFLTNKRLIFKDHKHEKVKLEFSIDLKEINKVEAFKTLLVIENGLAINVNANKTHTFIVSKFKTWLHQLRTNENAFSQMA